MTNTLSILLQETQLAFKKKDYNLALGNLYKASKITKNTASINSLLKKVQQKMLHTGQISKTISLPQLSTPWNISPSLLVIFLLLFAFRGLVSVYKKNKLSFKYWISLAVFSSYFFYTANKQYNFYFKPQAISLVSNLNLRLAPDSNSPVLFKLSYARLLKVRKLKNQWALVQDQGQVGWVKRNLLFFTSFHRLDILWEL
ncbi:MAG: SH3 domain-containing protein [Bdellovibrionales bacterium]|nr:SH3 domain-containing protein [Bdellovibrionales bacterium]